MKALVYHGDQDVRIDQVEDPKVEEPTDVVVKVTLSAICGSDLHLYGGFIPAVEKGDILGHEFMGEVVDAGPGVKNFRKGDRVLVPFTIACGSCYFCERDMWSLCDESNRNRELAEKAFGFAPAGLYGYTKLFGQYAGGQAEFVRVPLADASIFKMPDGVPDEKLLFLGDVFPTGYMAAENADIIEGDTVAVWGAGPVGQFAIRSALMLGAGKVIAIDRFPERLAMAASGGAETINYEEVDDLHAELKSRTDGRGPDSAIDAVGMEAHGGGTALKGMQDLYDRAKQTFMLESDRPVALRQVIYSVRKGGTLSVPGVYSGLVDKFPMGVAFNKGLTVRMGQTHVQKYVPMLLDSVLGGEIDPSFVITHRMSLDDAPEGYKMFREKENECIKVVLRP